MVLVVTGTTGIAAATAALACEQGHTVFSAGLPEADLTIPGSAEQAIERCVAAHGRIDALFNVAGASGRSHGDGPLHECTDEGWNWTLDANLGTNFRMTRAVLRQMLTQDRDESGSRGAILNMSSVLATHPSPERFATHAYAAAKGAIVALTRSLAAHYAAGGIRVNVIAPGLTRTPMSSRAQSDPEIIEWLAGKQPLAAGMVEPADVARAALFLLGPDSRHITGQTMVVDAGWSLT